MSTVLIDNSTLTAVQRLTGNAPAPRSYDPQGDYAAFEALASTLLFYDDFYFVDDYKEDFRAQRAEQFRFARAIPIEAFPYDAATATAHRLTEDLLLDIRAGRMEPGIIKQFLESIGLHLTAAWQMQSSDYFLTLKVLADEPNNWDNRFKYSPLSALIFDQTLGREAEASDKALKLIASDGAEIGEKEEGGRTYKVGADIIEFAASLNWMTWRTAFYALTSAHFGSASCLHPIRHNFLNRWSLHDGVINSSEAWRQRLASFFGTQAREAVNAINAVADATEVGAELPLFAAWAVGRAGNVSSAIDFLLEIRVTADAIGLRQKLQEIEAIREARSDPNWKRELNRLAQAIQAEATALARKYGAEIGTAPTVSINAELAPIPSLGISREIELGNLGLRFGSARRVRGLFRNVVNDIAGYDNLGVVRNALMRQVKRTYARTIPALPIEERRYAGRESDWKKIM